MEQIAKFKDGRELRFLYSDIVFDQPFDLSIFSFKPEGYEVEVYTSGLQPVKLYEPPSDSDKSP
jgi:hypothetical protein